MESSRRVNDVPSYIIWIDSTYTEDSSLITFDFLGLVSWSVKIHTSASSTFPVFFKASIAADYSIP